MLTRTLPTQVADHVRERILAGELAPGERIVEADLAAELGVSRNTLRSALQTLTFEGLVEQSQFKSTHVARPTARDVYETYTLRNALEAMACRLAAERAATAGTAGVDAVVARMHAAAAAGDTAAMKAADFDFHTAVVELAGHARLREHYRMLHVQTRLYLHLTASLDYPLDRDRGAARGPGERDPRRGRRPRRAARRLAQHRRRRGAVRVPGGAGLVNQGWSTDCRGHATAPTLGLMIPTTSTRFTELLGCRVPIQQAPMGCVSSDPPLPVAVAEAGAVGMIAGVLQPPDLLEATLESLPPGPIGVSFLVPFLLDRDGRRGGRGARAAGRLLLGRPGPEPGRHGPRRRRARVVAGGLGRGGARGRRGRL